jgi:hypothetical protein
MNRAIKGRIAQIAYENEKTKIKRTIFRILIGQRSRYPYFEYVELLLSEITHPGTITTHLRSVGIPTGNNK